MKALDTPVLVGILHDAPFAKPLLRSLHGEEIATTELNIFELKRIAATGPRSVRSSREAALSKLRRRVTVLPVMPDSVAESTRFLTGEPRANDHFALVWGVLVAAGCSEWITTKPYLPRGHKLPFRVRVVAI